MSPLTELEEIVFRKLVKKKLAQSSDGLVRANNKLPLTLAPVRVAEKPSHLASSSSVRNRAVTVEKIYSDISSHFKCPYSPLKRQKQLIPSDLH